MSDSFSGDSYKIYSCKLNDFTFISKKLVMELLKTDDSGAKDFFSIYFDKYDIIHKLGHILRIECGIDRRDMNKGAEEEYYANLFAIKYFQYKKEKVFLKNLEKWIDYLLLKYNVKLTNDVMRLNNLFKKYTMDFRTYGALHFVSIKDSFDNKRSFEEIVYLLSGGKISSINKGIIMQAGINGSLLLNECKQVTFGMVNDMPEIEIGYLKELTIQKYEIIERIRQTKLNEK